MTKARTLADFNTTGVLTSTSTINPANLDSTGTIPSELLADVGGGKIVNVTREVLSTSLPATPHTSGTPEVDVITKTVNFTEGNSLIIIANAAYELEGNGATNNPKALCFIRESGTNLMNISLRNRFPDSTGYKQDVVVLTAQLSPSGTQTTIELGYEAISGRMRYFGSSDFLGGTSLTILEIAA